MNPPVHTKSLEYTYKEKKVPFTYQAGDFTKNTTVRFPHFSYVYEKHNTPSTMVKREKEGVVSHYTDYKLTRARYQNACVSVVSMFKTLHEKKLIDENLLNDIEYNVVDHLYELQEEFRIRQQRDRDCMETINHLITAITGVSKTYSFDVLENSIRKAHSNRKEVESMKRFIKECGLYEIYKQEKKKQESKPKKIN